MQDYHFDRQKHLRGKVYYNSYYGCFMIESIDGSEILKDYSIFKTIRTMKTNMNDILEVIGNIHQNKD